MKRLANPCDCDRLHMWTDGQPFRTDAGWDGYCTVVIDDNAGPLTPGQLYAYMGVGDKTSNECEYSGVILALEWAKVNRERVHIITDSDLIVGQVFRGDRCTHHLRQYRDRVVALLAEVNAALTWQGRDYNKAGWHNATVLIERQKARTRRQRERKAALRKNPKPPPNKALHAARRQWAYQTRDDDGLRYIS